MSVTFKEFLSRWVTRSGEFYAKDLEALPEDRLGESVQGAARTPYDFTWEVVVVNNRTAAQIRGDEVEAWPYEGWVVAPEEMRSKEKILGALRESVEGVLGAIEGASEEELTRKYVPEGREEETSLANACLLVAYHMGYHGGQLNFIQSLTGDMEIHWG